MSDKNLKQIEVNDAFKDRVDALFASFQMELDAHGIEIDHHCEFVSAIRIKGEINTVGLLHGNSMDIDWKEEE